VSAKRYEILWSETAERMLKSISDRRVQETIFKRVMTLASEPEKQGKPLLGPLAGLRSLRAAGQRYCVIYRVDRGRVVVLILALGLRRGKDPKDIYNLAKKLIKLGLVK